MTNIEAGTRKVKKKEALKTAGFIRVEPPIATTPRKQPLLLIIIATSFPTTSPQPVFQNTKSF